MTTTITAADRAAAWNIRFLRAPPSDRPFAGCYQPLPADQRFLTWARLHDDLRLCFDLTAAPAAPGRFLALWFRQAPTSDQRPHCIYLEPPGADSFLATLHAPIDVAGLGAYEDDGTATLDLTPVLHDASCSLSSWDLSAHLSHTCTTPLPVHRNPRTTYLPIPSSSTFSPPPSPAYPPDTKRARTSSGASSPRKRLLMPPDLDVNVKKLYQGTCAITQTNSSWRGSTMASGPGMHACHIVPKAMYRWFPTEDTDGEEMSEADRWNRANSLENCVLLDAFVHAVHDLRLLAIESVSERVRLFAPVEPLLARCNRVAALPRNVKPSRAALKWHYEMCVVENMCAVVLDAEGGAKRQPWRGGPVLVSDAMEECDVRGGAEGGGVGGVGGTAGEGEAGEGQGEAGELFPGAATGVKRKYEPSVSPVGTEEEMEERWFTQRLHERLSRVAQMGKGREMVRPWGAEEEWVDAL